VPEPRRVLRAYPHELSGGMRQRVLIAAAFAAEPRLIVADEPTTALDVTVQREVLRLIARMQAAHGTALLFVTHDLGVVSKVCRTLSVLYAGKVVEDTEAAPSSRAPPIRTPAPSSPRRRGTLTPTDRSSPCRPRSSRRWKPKLPPTTGGPMPDALPPRAEPLRRDVPTSAPPLFEVADLRLSLPDMARKPLLGPAPRIEILKGLTFAIPRGAVLGIVGGSGSGKTTLGRCLVASSSRLRARSA
jgi:ABC-type glutathione transport system ATPase component